MTCRENKEFEKNKVEHGELEECWKINTIYKCEICKFEGEAWKWNNKKAMVNREERFICCKKNGDEISKRKKRNMLKKNNNGYYECCDSYEENSGNKKEIYRLCDMCYKIIKGGKKQLRNHDSRKEEYTSECMDLREAAGKIEDHRNHSHTYTELNKKEAEILINIEKELGSHRYVEYYNIVMEYVNSKKIIYRNKISYQGNKINEGINKRISC